MRRVAIALAVLLALALAFAAGMRVGRGEPGPGERRTPATGTNRALYSPRILSDPAFLERQRENVEALERQCAETGKLCAEARAARRWFDEQAGKS